MTFNQVVLGSSPSGLTKRFKALTRGSSDRSKRRFVRILYARGSTAFGAWRFDPHIKAERIERMQNDPSFSKLFAEMTDVDFLEEVLRIAEGHDAPEARLQAIALDVRKYLRWKELARLLKTKQREPV